MVLFGQFLSCGQVNYSLMLERFVERFDFLAENNTVVYPHKVKNINFCLCKDESICVGFLYV